MSDFRTESADIKRIELAAAEWLIRRDRGFTSAEQDEFFQWLAADPRHGEWLACHQQSWKELDLLAQWRPEHSSEPNPDLLARRHSTRGWSYGLLAAASVALALVFWRPAIQNLPAPASPTVMTAQAYESRVLDDGSIVELNRGAAIEVKFTTGERRVRLVRGEAQFTVAKNPQRPFVVQAEFVDVRAIGTAFNVRLGAESVEVMVTEGRVRVNAENLPSSQDPFDRATNTPAPFHDIPMLLAGQRAIISLVASPRSAIDQVSEEEMTRLLGWRPKLLDFTATPLEQVVAEFNRHNREQLVIADPALGAVPIVASFRSDNVDGFLRLLEITAGVRTERSGNVITLRRAH